MSNSAWLFLSLTIFSAVAGLSTDSADGQTTAFVAAGLSSSLLLITLIVGRRIKFDPILR